MTYTLPERVQRPTAPERTAYLVASGDLRHAVNVAGWETQLELERMVADAFAEHGWTVQRAHEVDPVVGHGLAETVTASRYGAAPRHDRSAAPRPRRRVAKPPQLHGGTVSR